VLTDQRTVSGIGRSRAEIPGGRRKSLVEGTTFSRSHAWEKVTTALRIVPMKGMQPKSNNLFAFEQSFCNPCFTFQFDLPANFSDGAHPSIVASNVLTATHPTLNNLPLKCVGAWISIDIRDSAVGVHWLQIDG